LVIDTSLVSATLDANYRAGDTSGVATTKYVTLVPRIVSTNGADSSATIYAVATIGSVTGGPPQATGGNLRAVRIA
jgi:hypothetical protein